MALTQCLRLPCGVRGDVRAPKHQVASVPIRVQGFIQVMQTPHPGAVTGFSATTAVFVAGMPVLLSGLTPSGVACSWLLGSSIFSAFGVGGFSLVCAYFILGSAATKFRLKEKEEKGIAEKRSGRRGPGSVVGSGFAGMLCALGALAIGQYTIFQAAFVASFCSKLSDTVSSEVGKGFGKTTYLISTLQRVPPGTEGAVSAEGTAAGIAAALAYAVLALAVGQVTVQGAVICTVAATIANVMESYIGATSQGKMAWLTNDVVNVIQICIAAVIAGSLQAILCSAGL
eukprot:jgi/Ulvmu1/5380/UM022_0175.1